MREKEGNQVDWKKLGSMLFNKENLLAFALGLILIALFITTADDSPVWIYQGF